MSAVTALGTANPSANPTTSLTVTTSVQIPAGAKVIVTCALAVTTPFATCAINGMAAQQVWYINRSTNLACWTFFFDAYNAIETGAVITVTFTGTSGPGGTMNVCYVTGLQDGPPDTLQLNSGATNAVSVGPTGTPPAAPDYFAYAAYGYNSATAGTTTGNAYNALAEVIQATRVVKQEEAWLDFTHPVAAKTETWTDTAASAAWAGGIALWKQGVFQPPLREKSRLAFVYNRKNS